MKQGMAKGWRAVLDVVKRWFVMDNDTCPICGRVIFNKEAFVCANCRKLLKINRGPVCKRCGRALFDDHVTICKECQRVDDAVQSFDGGFSWLRYDDIAAKLMTGFKFDYRRELAFWTGRQMAKAAGQEVTAFGDAVLAPVPLHPNRLKERGYNQSMKIAEGIADVTGLLVDGKLLIRRTDTPHQLGADRAFRLTNVADAFAVPDGKKVSERRVILVDDVMTTGATLRACTKALKAAGVAQVFVMAAASTH